MTTCTYSRPFLSIEPGKLGGASVLVGHSRLSAEVLAGRAQANGIEDAMDDYDVSREEVLLAIWFTKSWKARPRNDPAFAAACAEYEQAIGEEQHDDDR